jgi:hypothetical protein
MSEQVWDLAEIDPDTRAQAEEEAARLGLSLADYLTDMLLRSTLAEQLAQPGATGEALPPPELPVPEPFALRHRLKSLERRLGTAVGSLDGAVQALDASLFDITARVGEVEALAGDTAHGLRQAQHEMTANLAAVRLRVADVEESNVARHDAAEAAHLALRQICAGVNQRVEDAEAVANHARASALAASNAYDALKYAVADDFSAFARDSARQLSAGLEEVRAAADAAAEHADAAVAHLVTELRGVREAIERRVEDHAAEARGRMQAAFADATSRMAGLAERVTENERFSQRAAEQLRAQLTDLEDGVHTALEETAETLRQANTALAGDMSRLRADVRAGSANMRAELGRDIADLREGHAAAATQLKLLDVAIGTTTSELTELRETFLGQIAGLAVDGAAQRETLERQVAQAGADAAAGRQDIARAKNEWNERFEALVSDFASTERENIAAHNALKAESQRVEACAFAALEKLARDIANGDAKLENDLSDVVDATLQARHHADAMANDLRQRVEDAEALTSARVQRLEAGLDALETETASVDERLAKLESAAHALDTEATARISRLEREMRASTRSDALELIEQLRARADAAETQSSEIAHRLHGVAKAVSRFTTQQVQAGAAADERLHRLELKVADFRLTQIGPPSEYVEAVEAIAGRLEQLEQRQNEALQSLHGDIVRFVADNDHRLAVLERGGAPSDFERQFADLRQRIEERILGVEQRGVRMLEHVADTISVLEQRLAGDEEARESA